VCALEGSVADLLAAGVAVWQLEAAGPGAASPLELLLLLLVVVLLLLLTAG
jgi:hypothetical protein